MAPRILTTFLLIAMSIRPSFSDGLSSHSHSDVTSAVSGTLIDVPAVAKDAAATVARFTAALSGGRLAAAGAELDAKVLIVEGGDAERSAAEYLANHAKADAAFLKTAHQQVLSRVARASGELAWVATESELHVQKDGKPVTVLSTETMVLRHGPAGWKIVHIHWSSRKKDPAAAH